jgi:hypothetical protein
MPAMLERLDEIDPADCRAHVATHFSAERVTRDYEAVYEAVLDEEASASMWSAARRSAGSSKR